MIYYTADLHFGHKNIIEYEDRPYKDVHEMTIKLIENWNSKVKLNDDIYVLGDFAFVGKNLPMDILMSFINQLNGKIHLIRGNHDSWVDKKSFNPRLFESIDYYKEIKDQGKDIVLCHYPIEDWDCKHHGAIHIHGHIHGRDLISHLPNRFNAGVDVNDYKPVTLEELKKKGAL